MIFNECIWGNSVCWQSVLFCIYFTELFLHLEKKTPQKLNKKALTHTHTHTQSASSTLPSALSAHSLTLTLACTLSHAPPLCLHFCWAELVLQHKDCGWLQHCMSLAFSGARWNKLLSTDWWKEADNEFNSRSAKYPFSFYIWFFSSYPQLIHCWCPLL